MFVQTASPAVVSRDTLVLYDVPDQTQWFLNRPERKAGEVHTYWLLDLLLMNRPDRAINADITYVPSHGKRPRSATIMLWNPDYDTDKQRLTYSWKPLGNSSSLPITSTRGGRALESVSLFLDSCPSGENSQPWQLVANAGFVGCKAGC